MTITEAQNILKNPLKFGDELQIKAKQLLTPVDMPLTWENLLDFLNQYPYHKSRKSPGWYEVFEALQDIEESIKDEIRNSI